MLKCPQVTPWGVKIDRRRFLYASGGFAALAVASPFTSFATGPVPTFVKNPFTLGVASGDPTADGMVLWTRLAPEPLAADGRGGVDPVRVPVKWAVALDDQMRDVVRDGTTTATPQFGHSVHVEVEGLKPGHWYWYQFTVGEWSSTIGRTRTMIPSNASANHLRFAAASCQHFEQGFYNAYQHMANEDLDLVLFLGDYIYEDGISPTLPRQHDGGEPTTLAAYRNRHALYKSDRHLQAAHAMCPWLVVWDDHEVENNWASVYDENGSTPDAFLPRRAAAFQAYYEHMPLRASAIPNGPDIRLFRRLQYGTLAGFHMLDTRQYRDNQACGDGTDIGCVEALDPARTITGAEQERWLIRGLSASTAAWNVLGQQVFMAQRDFEAGALKRLSMDGWDGYAPSRDRILSAVIERKVPNLVVLTGDVHANYAAELKANFDDAASAIIGSEFVTTSISSGGNGLDMPANAPVVLAENPHIKFVNTLRGYIVCDVTPQAWRTDYRVVPFVTTEGAPIMTRASFVVQAGAPGLQQL
jgi:alkaline phosphatase D